MALERYPHRVADICIKTPYLPCFTLVRATGGMLVYYRPDRPEPTSQSRQLAWRNRHWFLLTFLCVCWIIIALIHHGWADRLWIMWKRYYDREGNLWVVCIKFEVGSHVGLVGSSTGNLRDCACNEFTSYKNVGHCAWARRLDGHWFETSESLSLWFFQPGQATEYWADKNPIYLGPG